MNFPESKFINDNFFYICSDNLENVKPRLYGFVVNNNVLHINSTANIYCSQFSIGTYVNIYVTPETITVQQDYNGAYGVFIYKDRDFFAISNSFSFLAHNLSKKLTLNRKYAKYLVAENLATALFDATPIEEISILPRDNSIVIYKKDRRFIIRRHEILSRTIDINTYEGISLLDDWRDSYAQLAEGLIDAQQHVSIDLSGGFDSRASFAIFSSNVKVLNACRINSGPMAIDDYAIAQQISKIYNFSLNKEFTYETCKLSLDELIAANIFMTMGFHQHIYGSSQYLKTKLFHITGSGGEIHRDHWNMSREKFIQRRLSNKRFLPKDWSTEISNLIDEQIEKMKDYFKLDKLQHNDLLDRLYREGRARAHFGKGCMVSFLFGQLCINPLMDFRLDMLNPYVDENKDKSLLMALIYVRFASQILNIQFNGNRNISNDTLNFAHKINSKFPLKSSSTKTNIRIFDDTRIIPDANTQRAVSKDFIINLFESMLVEPSIAHEIKEIFGEDFYKTALLEQNEFRNHHNIHIKYRFAYTLVSLALFKKLFLLT